MCVILPPPQDIVATIRPKNFFWYSFWPGGGERRLFLILPPIHAQGFQVSHILEVKLNYLYWISILLPASEVYLHDEDDFYISKISCPTIIQTKYISCLKLCVIEKSYKSIDLSFKLCLDIFAYCSLGLLLNTRKYQTNSCPKPDTVIICLFENAESWVVRAWTWWPGVCSRGNH